MAAIVWEHIGHTVSPVSNRLQKKTQFENDKKPNETVLEQRSNEKSFVRMYHLQSNSETKHTS